MKKLFVLLILFLIVVAISLAVVINETHKVPASSRVQSGEQAASPATPAVTDKTTAAVATPSVEGNISLTVTAPKNNFSTSDGSVAITGKTSPGASVMINEYELKAGMDGTFSQTVSLDDGENYFSIVAYTAAGDVAEQELLVVKNVSNY